MTILNIPMYASTYARYTQSMHNPHMTPCKNIIHTQAHKYYQWSFLFAYALYNHILYCMLNQSDEVPEPRLR